MTKNLAWQGITAKEKTILLNKSMEASKKLKIHGKIKDSYLGLASTCIDIINTAEAAGKTGAWKKLHAKCMGIIKKIIRDFHVKNMNDWSPADFEVMATILAMVSSKNMSKAQDCIWKGILKARKTKNKAMEALLFAKCLKLDVQSGNTSEIPEDASKLLSLAKNIKDPRVLTRLYQAVAVGAKFLGMEIARKAKLSNQVLKAKSI